MNTIIKNRKFAVLITVLLCGTLLKAQTNTDTLRLTLKDALEIALSENLTIKIADQEITKQRYARKGGFSSLFPQIDFSGAYQYSIEKQTIYMDGIPGMEDGIKMGMNNTWSLGFSAGMPVVSVPLWQSFKLSAYDVELAVEKARSSRLDMIDQVKRAYYMVLLAANAYEVYKQAYDNTVYNYNEIKVKVDKGYLSEYDLIRANVSMKNAEPEVYNAENSLILAHWQLKVLLGLDLEKNVTCANSLDDYENSLFSENPVPFTSLANNSTLWQMDIQYAQLRKVRQMQIAQYYPSISAQFGYSWMSMSDNFRKFRWDPYSTVAVSLNVPIFSGGKRMFDVKQSKINMMQLENQRIDVERNLNMAVKQAVDQMNTSIKQYSAAKASVEESEKGYTITMKRYETGEGTFLDVNQAQLSMIQSQLNLNYAIYNYLVAKSSLEKLTGESKQE